MAGGLGDWSTWELGQGEHHFFTAIAGLDQPSPGSMPRAPSGAPIPMVLNML